MHAPQSWVRRSSGRLPLALSLSLGVLFGAATARAQSPADFGYIDANGLPAPGGAAPFFVVPSAVSLEAGRFAAGLRSSVLAEPISGSQPSPSPAGTDTSVVSVLAVHEVLLGVGVGGGFDFSLALPVHLPQTGQGLTGVGVGDALAPVALGDLRIGVGWALELGAWSLRPQGTVYLPTGQETEFAGERLPRGDLAVAASVDLDAWMIGASAGARLRETSEIGNLRWSSQLLLALGARYDWTDAVDTSLELVLAPTLGGQPTPTEGAPASFFPAEVLLGLHYRNEPLSFGLFGGTGLPLSVPSGGGLERGPTSPLVRVGLELRAAF